MSVITNVDTKIVAGMFVLLTFAGLRIDSRLRSLVYRSNLMNLTPATTGFEYLVGSKLWQH